MSIASEIQRLKTSKTNIKAQVNIDVDDINAGTDFIDDETIDDYADLIEDMQDAYKQYIPIHTKMIAKGDTSQSGTPTPTSPIEVKTVTGEQVVTICGKNLFNKDKATTGGRLDNVGAIYSASDYFYSNYIKVTPNTTYIKNSPIADAYHRVCFYSDKNISDFLSKSEDNSFTTPNNCQYLRFCGLNTELNTTQLEKGSSAITFEPYKGKDYEVDLKSKNLLHIDNNTQTSNGLTLEVKDGLIRITGKAGSGTYANFSLKNYINFNELNTIPNGTNLTFSVLNVAGTVASQMFIGISGNNYFLQPNSSTKYVTATKSADLTSCSIFFTTTENQIYNVFFDPMLVTGSTPSQFEPYYNYELCKIGTYQDSVKKSTGKNTANPNGIYLNYTLDTNGALVSSQPLRSVLYQASIEPNEQFVLSTGSGYQIGNLFFYNKNKTYLSAQSSDWGNDKSITTPNNAYYISFAMRRTDNGTMTQSDINQLYVQVEKGNQKTAYEPFGKVWYIEKNVGKLIVNGSESASAWSYPSANRFNLDDVGGYLKSTYAVTYYSNQYEAFAQRLANADFNTIATNSNYAFDFSSSTQVTGTIRFKDTRYTDLTSFKSWLGSNPVTFYYVLATPTTTVITDENLIDQLEAVQLQTGLNNISVSGDLPMILDLSKYIQIAENHL